MSFSKVAAHLFFTWILVLATPAAAQSKANQEPPIVKELKKHPLGFTLIGVGTVFSFIGFSGLFAGGVNPGYHCDREKNRRSGESSDECRDRISDQNEKFYKVMAGVMGTGLVVAGAGGALVFWEEGDQRQSKKVSLSIETRSPIITFTANL